VLERISRRQRFQSPTLLLYEEGAGWYGILLLTVHGPTSTCDTGSVPHGQSLFQDSQ
jgi:hypothetical protein